MRWPVNSLQEGPVTQKMFPFDDVVMAYEVGFHFKTVNFLNKILTEEPSILLVQCLIYDLCWSIYCCIQYCQALPCYHGDQPTEVASDDICEWYNDNSHWRQWSLSVNTGVNLHSLSTLIPILESTWEYFEEIWLSWAEQNLQWT